MAELRMPSLGADMEAGTIVEWRIQPGDEIHRGDIVAVVDTDKADIEMESFDSGVVQQILVPVGERVPIGTPLAIIGEAAPPSAPAPAQAPAATIDGVRVSAVLQRLARHLGVDLAAVRGSGPHGEITRDDIVAAAGAQRPIAAPVAAEAPAVAAPPVTAEAPPAAAPPAPRPGMRNAIAALMTRSAREIPQYHVAVDIDLAATIGWLERHNLDRPVSDRLLPIAAFLKVTALAARRFRDLNGFWIDGRFEAAVHVHVGVATSLRSGGLVAPALHDVDEKDLPTVMRELRDLVERARTGRLRSSEMSDPTLTVTNLGERGVDVVHGLIYPPQVALVGFGRIADRPWASGGLLGVRPVVTASLSGDHRATDGMRGAQFLNEIDRLLQEPDQW